MWQAAFKSHCADPQPNHTTYASADEKGPRSQPGLPFWSVKVILLCLTIIQIQTWDQSEDEELIKFFLALVSENKYISFPLSYFAA